MKSHKSTVKPIMFTFVVWLYQTVSAAQEIDLATLPLYFCQSDVPDKSQTHVLLNSISMSDSTDAYQTGFNSSTWSGILRKFSVNKNTDGSISLAKQFQWDAGLVLDRTLPNQRIITTYNAATKTTIPFELSNLPAEAQIIFDQSPITGVIDNLGSQRINYLHGDRTLETAGGADPIVHFRVRGGVLGDIVNSLPVSIGGAAKNILGPDYQVFFEQFRDRPATVYVGANDGMLHAFSGDTGSELFAYIPSPLLTKLAKLTAPSYLHDSYMDGNIHVGEAQVSGAWKTILAAGMGSGAKGVFALDVTAPNEFMKGARVLFEFTDQDDADIGYVSSPPFIAKIAVGKNAGDSINYQYFIVVPGGYNSSNPDRDNFLFLLSLNKNPNSPWSINNNYYKLKTGTNNISLPNALATPGIALNMQGAMVYAYSGDLQGNIWRFDFSAADAPFSKPPTNIFTAVDSEHRAQAITTPPVVSFAPGGGYLLLFGTGKYIESTDTNPANFTSNSFYSIRDTLSDDKNGYLIQDRNELARRILSPTPDGYDVTGTDFNYGDATLSGTKKGWFVDFLNGDLTGERSISKALIAYGNVFFNTLIPNSTDCNIGGTSKSYMLDLLTGKTANSKTVTGTASHIGVLGSPVIIPTSIELGERNPTGQRNNTQFYSILNFGTGGAKGSSDIIENKATIKAGRLSWREIQNWQDLK